PAAGAADTAPGKPNGKSTLYITDKIPITLRSGKTNEHRIIRSLYSGAKLQILETDDTHARVKTEDGAIGWVLKQYLTEEPAARFILPSIQEKLAKIQEEHTELKKQFKELSKEKNELAKTAAKYEQLETAHKTLVAETAHLRKISAESTQIFQENQTLARNGTSLQAQRDVLLGEIKELREGNDKLWFLTGAGVIFIGIVIGAMLARTRKTRGSSWSTSSTDSLLLR
ncbi:MAG TPA: TIGR04211 family SH3 domain-containing protein, partial [Gammaproteobacteria bacterium]